MAIRFAVCGACGSLGVSVRRRGVRAGFVRCSCGACGHVAFVAVASGDQVLPGYRRRGAIREKLGKRKMRFDVRQVRDCLVEQRKVYTVRSYNASDGEVEVSQVGLCRRRNLGEVSSREELSDYVALSGFNTLDEWWGAILRFIKDGKPKWLYEVVATGNSPARRHPSMFIPNSREGLRAKDMRYKDLAGESWSYSIKCRCGKVAHLLDAARCQNKPQVWSLILACSHCRTRFHIFRRSERKEVSHA